VSGQQAHARANANDENVMDATYFDPGLRTRSFAHPLRGPVSHAGRTAWLWKISTISASFSRSFLREQGYRVTSADDFPEGAALLRSAHPTLLMTDVRLPNGDGRDLEKLARAMDVPVLIISASPQDIDVGSDIAFLQKPFGCATWSVKLRGFWGPALSRQQLTRFARFPSHPMRSPAS
jgi:CheY-like chemotaxis protein